MALKPCRECEREVSSSAYMCPHCGIRFPVPRDMTRPSTIFVWMSVGLIALIVVAWTWEVPRSPELGPATRPINLDARLLVAGDRIVLENANTFSWTRCRAVLNDRGGGFHLDTDSIPPGETRTLPLRDFTKSDGARFDATLYAVRQVSLFCDTPRRRGVAQWEPPLPTG